MLLKTRRIIVTENYHLQFLYRKIKYIKLQNKKLNFKIIVHKLVCNFTNMGHGFCKIFYYPK